MDILPAVIADIRYRRSPKKFLADPTFCWIEEGYCGFIHIPQQMRDLQAY
jgi:hypothetical protein